MDAPGTGIDLAGLIVAFKVLAAVMIAFAALGLAAVLALIVLETRKPARKGLRRQAMPAPPRVVRQQPIVGAACLRLHQR